MPQLPITEPLEIRLEEPPGSLEALARPAVGVVAVITALGTWNEFLFALLFVHSDAAKTLPLGLLAFSGSHSTDYGLTFAALSIMSLPLLLGYAFVQRTLIEGSAATLG